MYEKILEKPRSFYDNYPRKDGDITVTHYCPGCGHGIAHKMIAEALSDLNLAERTILISPVGCSVFAYYYFDVGNIQAAHGRAPAVATGVKRANPDSIVISYQGDGDLAAIGGDEIMQAANRGEQITVFFINNAIYGMTGGQMAPTTLVEQKTTTSPYGRNPHNEGFPIRVCELLSSLEAPVYIERVSLHNSAARAKARKAIRKALQVQADRKGFSLVEILSGCPTGWKVKQPSDSLDWIEKYMLPYFPVGVFKDNTEKAEPFRYIENVPPKSELPKLIDIPMEDKVVQASMADLPGPYRNPRIKIAGFGGQGVLSLGVAIAQLGLMQGYDVSWLPSYGPEMRGGTAHCHVMVSEHIIGSPLVTASTVCVAMNKPSLEKFEKELVPGGLLITNTSMIDIEPTRKDVEWLPIPATEMASELGNIRFGNMVVLGAYLQKTGLVPLKVAFDGLHIFLKAKRFIPDNEKAIQVGADYVSKKLAGK
ncbi:MAG: 2-oxoacid:acceptor oxidoreductase family protein [Acidobacteria bacterium]|nr:2-oxoacid:acceptor oxidoreductase family protein [Acidobacteriota bacterium]